MFGPICLFQVPGTAPPGTKPDAATASPGCGANCEAPHMAAQAHEVKDLGSRALRQFEIALGL
jgi:hypothetical protein